MKKIFALTSLCLTILFSGLAQAQPVFYSDKAVQWADSLLQKMPLEQKLGQLFMVAAYSNRGPAHKAEIEKLIKDQHIGGLIFMQGGPVRQANLNNHFQDISNIPLLIGMDAEWDLAMRLDSTFKFPWAMTAGAVQDSALVYKMGYQMGLHCKRLGVHISFSPVMDINTNPKNPIINARSFGQDRENVVQKSRALMHGLQDAGVLACGKHFPGHGDTEADSHKTLPQVNHDKGRLDEVEMYPYDKLIDQGLASVMVAHLDVPKLDSTGKPASLSKKIVTNILKKQLGFEGLIITDALNMKGVSAKYAPGDVDLEAFKAGNDILLFAEDVPKAKMKIMAAISKEEITEDDVDSRVKKVLMAKYHLGLNKKQSAETANLVADLNDRRSEVLRKQLMEEALTLLINKSAMLPITELSDKKIACVQMGAKVNGAFLEALNFYTQIDGFELDGMKQNDLLNKLSRYDLVVVGYHTDNKNPWKSYKPTEDQRRFLNKLSLQNEFVLTLFANPYVLGYLPEAEKAQGLIMAYQNNDEANRAAAQLIFGAIGAKGRMPVSGSNLFDVGYGQQSKTADRLGFALPEELGIDPKKLTKIDSTAQAAINAGATPGCQILIAKSGKIFYNQNFGFHTYKNRISVTDQSVYDLASITKIAATLPFVMKLYQDGKLDLDDELGDVYPPAKGTNKEHLRIRDILAHQSGLQSWIPFYLNSMVNNQPDPKLYREEKSGGYDMQVSDHLYLSVSYPDSIYKTIFESALNGPTYKYSDLGYYFFKAIVEEAYRKPLDQLAMEELYKPLGAKTTGYHPLSSMKKDRIPPTEQDNYFRYDRIQGTVHDQGASMMNGVGGHAGLFSNAQDLAKLMQMYLQNGDYGGKHYLDSATIGEFARCQFCEDNNRRGAGFDKPQLSGPGPTCACVSMLSFGHTGFTGTIAWVDPEEDIVFVFLSNRTWPDAENRKLIRMNTRSLIQEYIYEALNTYNE